MNVRQKITLLITAAGFLASLIFSLIIIWQMMDQPYRLMDADLRAVAQHKARIVVRNGENLSSESLYEIGEKNYWLEIYALDSGKLIYQSSMAKIVKMPEVKPGIGVTVSRIIPREKICLDQDRQNEVTFRLKSFRVNIGGKFFLVRTGLPMEWLDEEIWHIVMGVGSGLAIFVLVLLGVSYYFAGFILRPVRIINEQARNISEKHLDRRIPTSDKKDEFNALARTLNRVFNRLEQAFIHQKRLLADASHELKTPLTMMRLSLDEIRSAHVDTISTLESDSLLRLTTQVLRMERLIKSLLDLSALEITRTTTLEFVDLQLLLNSLVADYQLMADACKIKIELQLQQGIIVSGNFEKLNRAFSNLIDNAIKYNYDQGQVLICGESTGTGVNIVISNTGPGIDEGEIAKVFEPFYRVEPSRAQIYGGVGLGLAIVKRIFELHNGSITFISPREGITEVSVFLPKAFKKL